MAGVSPVAPANNNANDPRRPNKVHRYKPATGEAPGAGDDPVPDYMNVLGMIFR